MSAEPRTHLSISKRAEGWKVEILLGDDVTAQLAESGRAQVLLDDDGPAANLDVQFDGLSEGLHGVAELWVNRT